MIHRARLGSLACTAALLSIVSVGWAQEPSAEELDAPEDPIPCAGVIEDIDRAACHAGIADYEASAGYYEQFAAQHPDDPRVPDALHNAYLFRVGLDQRDAAKRNLAAYERLYEHDDKTAAGIFWSQHDLFDSWQDQRRHALDYLARYDLDGGLDRAVVAEATIARIDWRRSCRRPLLLDSCITIERERARPNVVQATPPSPAPRFRRPARCGLPTQGIVTVHPRDAKLASAAQARFEKALKLARSNRLAVPEDDPRRKQDFRDAWAMAMVYQADQQYEEFLRLEPPADLEFPVLTEAEHDSVEYRIYRAQRAKLEDSVERFRAFYEQKLDLAMKLQNRYAKVKDTGSAEGMVAAAFRVASTLQHAADQLHRAKVPRGLRSEAQVRAHCGYFSDYAKPIEEQAMAAWTYCVERSTQFQYFNEFSRACEEMAERNPKYYPATHELFGESVYAGSGLLSVGVLDDPGEEQQLAEDD